MATGSRHTASIAFIIIPGLEKLPSAVSLRALECLHSILRKYRSGPLKNGVQVLSALTGAIIFTPDTANIYLHQHIGAIAADCYESGIAIRIGVTHGEVEELLDVDGSANFIGKPINIAARLAFAKQNTGCAFDSSFVASIGAAVIGDNALKPSDYPEVGLKGKEHDPEYPCRVVPVAVFRVHEAVVPTSLPQGVSPENLIAAVLAYDLPHFSAGDLSQLSKRFRAVIDVMQQAKVSREHAQFFFAPGGDGGLIVFGASDGYGKRELYATACSLSEILAVESEDRRRPIQVDCRIGLHYGPVQLYLNAEGVKRPTGQVCFVANEVAGDQHAKAHEGIVVTSAFREIIAHGSDRRLADEFEALPPLQKDGIVLWSEPRYVRKSTSPSAAAPSLLPQSAHGLHRRIEPDES